MVTLLLSEASTSEEEHFKLMLVQTEIERVKFLIRAYLRTRLSKVSLLSLPLSPFPSRRAHLLSFFSFADRTIRSTHQLNTSDALPSLTSGTQSCQTVRPFSLHLPRLSFNEAHLSSFYPSSLKRYNALLIAHYKSSVLNSLPPSLHSLTELHNDGTDMGEFSFPSLVRTDSRRVFRSFSLTLSLPPSPFRP